MKTKLKAWLGITELEKAIGKPKEKKRDTFLGYSFLYNWLGNENWLWDEPIDRSLRGENERLQNDFEELDKKFDALERYLKIEFFKKDEVVQVYDWADKKHTEGFRDAKKTYEEMKVEKEKKPSEDYE